MHFDAFADSLALVEKEIEKALLEGFADFDRCNSLPEVPDLCGDSLSSGLVGSGADTLVDLTTRGIRVCGSPQETTDQFAIDSSSSHAGERVFDSIFNSSEKGDEPQCDNPGKSSTVARMVPSTREVPLSEEQETKRHSSCSFSEIFTDDLIRLVAASGGNRSKSITGKSKNNAKELVFYKCSYCNFSGRFRSQLQRHISGVHYVERRFSCELCEKRYMYKGDLARHVNQKHSVGNVPERFQCAYCSTVLSSKYSLRNHEAGKHLLEKPFVCPVCDFAFVDAYRLKKHTFTHQSVRLYGCGKCKYGARNAKDLKTHLSRVHMLHSFEGTVELARCGGCKFPEVLSLQKLKDHLRVCHRELAEVKGVIGGETGAFTAEVTRLEMERGFRGLAMSLIPMGFRSTQFRKRD
ncbi:unnamed protein product [Enterobius vermicularis]|uniref:C2H2-type domain-containing protein n=1 Tax=Enterobius vermicularis TaxID=51028 RepID=A0A158Q9I9_ENTVE|nr:unnamed protein product [Enterobius vermicularis]